MPDHGFVGSIRSTEEFFERSTRCLTEEDSGYTPVPGTYTVAQHVAHVAQTIDWFMQGIFSPQGLSEDFETLEAAVRRVNSLQAARAWMKRSCDAAAQQLEARSAAEMAQPMAPGILGGQPRAVAIEALVDHTAHHRGALTIYARLLGKKPAMPYMEL